VETELIRKTREYAEGVLSNGLSEKFHYHNLEHTRSVVEAAKEIGGQTELSMQEMEIVTVAAWLHDVGFQKACHNHEEAGVIIAKELLGDWDVEDIVIDKVTEAIAATKMPQSPKDTISKVICDADLFHLSTNYFEENGDLLRRENAIVNEITYTDEEWLDKNINFFKTHKYFTNYGQTVLEPRKKKNLKKLKNYKKKIGVDQKYVDKLEDEVVKLKNKLEKGQIQKPDRGIETMFRITSKNHLTLSGMADNKANIMISINSIILSVLVSVLFRKFEEYPNLIIPTLLLVTVCLTTIVFAVLATRPNISSGTFTTDDIKKQKTNLLFFGNFHSMELDNYMWGMREMMKDAEFLYGSMIKDIYFLGIVLGKKYKLLRISYTVFMFGFVISILAFIFALFIYPVHPNT